MSNTDTLQPNAVQEKKGMAKYSFWIGLLILVVTGVVFGSLLWYLGQ
jgi:hypothetical protein